VILYTGCGKCKEAEFKSDGVFPVVNNLKDRQPGHLLLPPFQVAATLWNPGLHYLCLMRKLRMDELPRKNLEEFHVAEKLPVILLLENIRSMHNVGSVFRTADAFLAEAIFLCGYTPRPPHRDIHKTALGATDTVRWEYFERATDAAEMFRVSGYRLIGVEQAVGSIPLQDFRAEEKDKMVFVFGNEVEGVSNELLALCDECIEIPQFGMKHSLNVSVATGMVLWELARSSRKFQTIK
jgi:23S rRNA (guanosine2251-2'-O)-methyltransferase